METITRGSGARPMIMALLALSLVEKLEPVQVRFPLCLRDRTGKWMQDGCKFYMDSYMASCVMATWDYFQKPLLGGRPNTKPPGDHGTPNAHHRWLILFYHVWGPPWIEIHWNSIWLRAWSHTLHLRICDHNTRFQECLEMALWTLSFWALTISW